MALLQQNETSATFYAGWYGTCGECEPFLLITGTGSEASYVHDSISRVFCISDNAQSTVVTNGLHTNPNLISIQPIKQLECGKSYRIILKEGTGALEIPNFRFSSEGADDEHRIKDDCAL